MFKYFNEEETKEIFNNNKHFKNILENKIYDEIKKPSFDNWRNIDYIKLYFPYNLKEIMFKNSNCYYQIQIFIKNIDYIEQKNNCLDNHIFYSILLYYFDNNINKIVSKIKFYDPSLNNNNDDDSIIILKGEKYFYIFCLDAYLYNIELFFMKRTDENKNDSNYYKIEMDITL